MIRRVVFLSLVLAAPCVAQTPRQLIERARAHIENVQGDSAHPLLVNALARTMPDSDRVRGFTLLGITELLRGNRTAARTAFERALGIDLTLRVDSLADLQDDVRLVFAEARTIVASAAPVTQTAAPRVAPRLAVRLSSDTLIAFDNPRLVIGVEPSTRSRVVSSIVAADAPSRPIWTDTQTVAARQSIMWSMRRGDGLLPPGRYVLRSQATDSAGMASPVIERRITLARARADTQAVPAPLAAGAFLPEKEPGGSGGGRNTKTLITGGALALLIAATPMMLGEPTLNEGLSSDPTAPVVAGGVAIASVVGFLKGGRKPNPVFAENARKNRDLREKDRSQREAILRSNALAISRAPIRVTVEP